MLIFQMNAPDHKDRTKQFALRVMHLVDALPDTPKGRAVASQLVQSGMSVAANYRAACRGRSHAEFISKIGVAEEEADETALWLELIVEDKLLPETKIAPLLKEANELTAIMAASYISASRNKRDASANPKSAISNYNMTSTSPNPQTSSRKNGSTPLIQLNAVTKVFLTDEVETHALSGIHLDIRDGEYVSIAGPSGCGKSTLLSILGLLDTPSNGSYALKSNEVANLSFADRARIRNREIGFIFQSFNLIGDVTVFENVELPLTYRGMGAGDRKTLVTQALDRVGMAHRAKHLPSQLSGGQQQRVAVARALAGKPAILLADEPTGNLDSRNGEAVMNLLKELHAGGATICMVTHDERFAQHADRTVHLFDGRVVEDRIAA